MAAAYQDEVVIPHCGRCRAPCCELRTLVLELGWRRLRGLWGLRESREQFDRLLRQGRGPEEIRSQDGLYYAHGRTCPAYGKDGRCGVYGSPLKPDGCSDFPVCEDDGTLLADLRCEAVDLGEIRKRLQERLGPGAELVVRENPEFPFLVTLGAGSGGGGHPG